MTRAYGPDDEVFVRRMVDADRRLTALERMPSGKKSIGARHIGVLPGVSLWNDAAQSIPNTGVRTPITFNTETGFGLYDSDGMHAAGSASVIIVTPGVYDFEGGLGWASAPTTGLLTISLNTTIPLGVKFPCTQFDLVKARKWRYSAGDIVTLTAEHNSGAAINTSTAAYYTPYLSGIWICP